MSRTQRPTSGLVPPNPPGGVAALVLGILSLVFAWLPLVGVVLGIVGLVLARKAARAMRAEPDRYHPGGPRVGGFVCSIIGTVAGALCLAFWLVVVQYYVSHPEAWRTYRQEVERRAEERRAR